MHCDSQEQHDQGLLLANKHEEEGLAIQWIEEQTPFARLLVRMTGIVLGEPEPCHVRDSCRYPHNKASHARIKLQAELFRF